VFIKKTPLFLSVKVSLTEHSKNNGKKGSYFCLEARDPSFLESGLLEWASFLQQWLVIELISFKVVSVRGSFRGSINFRRAFPTSSYGSPFRDENTLDYSRYRSPHVHNLSCWKHVFQYSRNSGGFLSTFRVESNPPLGFLTCVFPVAFRIFHTFRVLVILCTSAPPFLVSVLASVFHFLQTDNAVA